MAVDSSGGSARRLLPLLQERVAERHGVTDQRGDHDDDQHETPGVGGPRVGERGQAQALSTLGSTPLVVLTAAEHVADPARAAAHARMAELSTNSSHREADATHAGLMDEERGAATSVRAVDDVVQAVRSGSPLPPD
jgi:hypothetical protein